VSRNVKPAAWLFVSTLVLAAASGTVFGDRKKEVEEFNKRVVAELKERNPEAAALLVQADEARDAGAFAKAVGLYAKVREMAPYCVHATRRECMSLVMLGRREEGIPLCREAVATEASADNRIALADALVRRTGDHGATQEELAESKKLTYAALGSSLLAG